MKKLAMIMMAMLFIFTAGCKTSVETLNIAVELNDHAASAYIAKDRDDFNKYDIEVDLFEQYDTGMALAAALAEFENFSLIVPFSSGKSDHYYVEFLEEDLYISSLKPPVPTLNTLRGKIISHKENAERVHVKIDINGTIIKGNIPWYMWHEIDKDDVYVIIKYRGTKLKGVNDGDL